MEQDTHRDTARTAAGIVTFLGLYQGAVPLVVRGLFDRDQRFAAPALWLPSPWWWLACLAIVTVTIGVVVVLEGARPRPTSTHPGRSPLPPGAPDAGDDEDKDGGGHDALSGVVLLVGIYNGVAPFVARLVFDGDLLLAFPLRLPAPWWWITSLAVLAATAVLLELIDNARQRRRAAVPGSET